MDNVRIRDVRILETQQLISPEGMAKAIPVSAAAAETVVNGRRDVQSIIRRIDDRFLAVVGPCSIHNKAQALEYASRLVTLRDQYKDKMCIIMRVYFEKPRTALGWRGFIVDPGLDGTYAIDLGLREARKLLVAINEMGLPCGSELLDPIVPQYIGDLVSWASIGARTTESQVHREMASGLSMPVGFKNATDGDVQIAINGITSARQPHSFIGINHLGMSCIMQTTGNTDCHLILRGGKAKTNYDEASVTDAVAAMKAANLRPTVIIDCSHGNSQKDPLKQVDVFKEAVHLRKSGIQPVVGCMLESFLKQGNQKLTADRTDLAWGVSITDACLSWEDTEALLKDVYGAL